MHIGTFITINNTYRFRVKFVLRAWFVNLWHIYYIIIVVIISGLS